MLNLSDIEQRNIILLHSFDGEYKLKVSLGNIQIENQEGEVLTKLSRQTTLALFIIGHYTLSSPLVDYCQKNAIALAVFNTHLRPIFFLSQGAEANFLLRQKQYQIPAELAFEFAKKIISNKILNHIHVLKLKRKKSDELKEALTQLQSYHDTISDAQGLDQLMGIEGNCAKLYFKHHFATINWQGRKPRLKIDPINVVLDIGYTLLFNYIETNAKLFGFDTYVGVLHQLWFKRKSLICDLVEPFRCIIDRQVLKGFQLKQFQLEHFSINKQRYVLQNQYIKKYNEILMTCILDYKLEIFIFTQQYYRCFMKQKSALYENFEFIQENE
ncbi:type V CRISPR-associated endonuclease Cas1 [Acinetobacter indicus]|uniref:type V CRISPR-associated endonuclease Cas1 n=1 Tax=Acinetobacter indicus TaxID=756892 RepID=UPI000CEC0368|nr:type V CRISPR-associated endonuclease Cas1 [Acinetobacter indicus]